MNAKSILTALFYGISPKTFLANLEIWLFLGTYSNAYTLASRHTY